MTYLLRPDAAGIAAAAAMLRNGGLVAFPTETVYGLGGDATDARAVAAIYDAKERPRFNPLIAHVATSQSALALGLFDDNAQRLAEAFWPGPLTLVVPRAPLCPVSELALAGHDSVAIRVPDHPIAIALLAAAGRPICAPSANRSGHVSPTEAAHVLADLDGRIDAVVDGGPTTVGLESTIIACFGSEPILLRPGGVPREQIEDVLGMVLAQDARHNSGAPLAPGLLESHYAPRALVRLDALDLRPGEALLSFGPAISHDPRGEFLHLSLSPTGDLREAASNLFRHLRSLDAAGAVTIAVMPIPEIGLGRAINDRLRRAAAGR